ncbi:MAG TPA: universal stress protein [Kofleriaceae bacterium]|nr:universal stress protein [Kofleriaceae bacterium]
MVPIAGNPNEQATIDYAAVLALALRASITLVHVDETPNAMVGIVPGASVEGDLAADRIVSKERLATVVDALARLGVVDTKTTFLTSPAVPSALLELATREQFDLIIMATHARTGISRALLGSVAEHLVRHAPCPVMTVHLS